MSGWGSIAIVPAPLQPWRRGEPLPWAEGAVIFSLTLLPAGPITAEWDENDCGPLTTDDVRQTVPKSFRVVAWLPENFGYAATVVIAPLSAPDLPGGVPDWSRRPYLGTYRIARRPKGTPPNAPTKT